MYKKQKKKDEEEREEEEKGEKELATWLDLCQINFNKLLVIQHFNSL